MVYGCVEHHLWGFLYGQSSLDPERLADQITDLVCDGIHAHTEALGLGAQTERLATLVDRVEIALESRRATGA
jgi:hypothetical protein